MLIFIKIFINEFDEKCRDSNLYRRPADGEDDDDDEDETGHPPLVPQRLPGDLVAHRMPEPLEHAQVEDHDQDERNGVAGDEEDDLERSHTIRPGKCHLFDATTGIKFVVCDKEAAEQLL